MFNSLNRADLCLWVSFDPTDIIITVSEGFALHVVKQETIISWGCQNFWYLHLAHIFRPITTKNYRLKVPLVPWENKIAVSEVYWETADFYGCSQIIEQVYLQKVGRLVSALLLPVAVERNKTEIVFNRFICSRVPKAKASIPFPVTPNSMEDRPVIYQYKSLQFCRKVLIGKHSQICLSSPDEGIRYDEPGFSHSCFYAPSNSKYRVV